MIITFIIDIYLLVGKHTTETDKMQQKYHFLLNL